MRYVIVWALALIPVVMALSPTVLTLMHLLMLHATGNPYAMAFIWKVLQ